MNTSMRSHPVVTLNGHYRGHAYSQQPPFPPAEYDAAFRQAHRTLQRPNFEGHYPPLSYSPSPQPSPYNTTDYESSIYGPCGREEEIRRTNLAAQLVNGMITHHARCAQLQPKMDRQARLPIEFQRTRTVEDVRSMDISTIERMLNFYELPTDLRSFSLRSMEGIPEKVIKQAKLCTLFDFLGACQLAEHERQRAERWKGDMAELVFK